MNAPIETRKWWTYSPRDKALVRPGGQERAAVLRKADALKYIRLPGRTLRHQSAGSPAGSTTWRTSRRARTQRARRRLARVVSKAKHTRLGGIEQLTSLVRIGLVDTDLDGPETVDRQAVRFPK